MDWLLISWPLLIVLGLSLRMALRLTYGARGPEPDDPIYILLSVTSWVFIGMGLAPAILGGVMSFVGMIIVVLAVATIVEVILQRRAMQRRTMCTLLSLMIERGAQLESSVIMTGQSFRGIVGRSAKRLFDSLHSGVPLSAAVVRHSAALPAEASAYLAAGRTPHAQSAALRELSRGDRGELAMIWRACIDRVSYLAAVLMIMLCVLTFVMVKIVPEFEKIFEEFDVQLPRMTLLAVNLSEYFVTYLALPFFCAILLLLVGSIVIGICYLCDVPVLKWLGDWFFRGRRTSDVLRVLAIATEQRQPLAEVLLRVGLVYPSAAIRRRVSAAAEMVTAGNDWREALLKASVLSPADCSLLHTAERVGNQPWALRAIADRREKQSVYVLTAALHVVYPLAIVGLGFLVAFFVIALFIPIVKLINGLT